MGKSNWNIEKEVARMNDLYLTDEDIHGCEEDSEVIKLRGDLKKAEETINDLKDVIDVAIARIEKINQSSKRLFAEEKNAIVKKFLELEIKHNSELLELLQYDR